MQDSPLINKNGINAPNKRKRLSFLLGGVIVACALGKSTIATLLRTVATTKSIRAMMVKRRWERKTTTCKNRSRVRVIVASTKQASPVRLYQR